MSLDELREELTRAGVSLKPIGGALDVRPKSRLTPDLIAAIRAHKAALLSLLEPARSNPDGLPEHWRHVPELPAFGGLAETTDEWGPRRYRVALFGAWYLVRFELDAEEGSISVVSTDRRRRVFASLHELYRWAWAEHYAAELRYRAVN